MGTANYAWIMFKEIAKEKKKRILLSISKHFTPKIYWKGKHVPHSLIYCVSCFEGVKKMSSEKQRTVIPKEATSMLLPSLQINKVAAEIVNSSSLAWNSVWGFY